jgi:hypothetical protein
MSPSKIGQSQAESTIAGPLSYEGGALTSPGTNVAIDRHGRIHVLYIDSNKRVPMYTSSHDHGATWSSQVNVNPRRPNDAHMWPCLSCTKHGDLQGGSMVYDQTLGKYSILLHLKAEDEDEWKTVEVDNGPWSAAGPSPNFRIGFGDYFDCDSLPEFGVSVMAWSETANGQQPWQSWVRIVDRWEWEDERVSALEDEIDRLTEAFELGELPFPRTEENVASFKARVEELRKKQRTAQTELQKRRDANSVPAE